MDSSTKAPLNATQGPHVLIIGAGIVGLSTAAALMCSESSVVPKLRITVVASEFSPDTTSDIAGGVWLPYQAKHEELTRWCKETIDWLTYLHGSGKLPLNPSVQSTLEDEPNAYRVALADCISYEATPDIAADRATWQHVLKKPVQKISPDFVPPRAKEVYLIPSLPLVTTSPHMQRMRNELQSTGRVEFVLDKNVTSIRDAAMKYGADVAVNCAGLGARKLMQDSKLHPVRGCLLTLELPQDLKEQFRNKMFMFDDNPEGLTYVLPREDACYVGGTYLPDEWDTAVSEEEQVEILERATRVVPELKRAKVLARRAGLRPCRPSIRLERDHSFDSLPSSGTYSKNLSVFHNYGHGGSGWTVHWGCAKNISKLVLDELSSSSPLPSAKL